MSRTRLSGRSGCLPLLLLLAAWVCAGPGCQSPHAADREAIRGASYRKQPADAAPPAPQPPGKRNETADSKPIHAAEAEAEGYVVPIPQWTRRWSRLLGRIVSPQTGRVDYAYLRRHPRKLKPLIHDLAPPRTFHSPRRRLAFLINAYNALTLAAVVREYPLSSVRDVEDFFSRPQPGLLGRRRSLEAVRDRLIRPMGDPRAHLAMTYAAVGGPRLRAEAYTADQLDQQLDEQTREFLSSPQHNAAIGGEAMVSPLFDWFARDFQVAPYGSVRRFIRRLAPPRTPLARLLNRPNQPPLTHLQFNWALNER